MLKVQELSEKKRRGLEERSERFLRNFEKAQEMKRSQELQLLEVATKDFLKFQKVLKNKEA